MIYQSQLSKAVLKGDELSENNKMQKLINFLLKVLGNIFPFSSLLGDRKIIPKPIS